MALMTHNCFRSILQTRTLRATAMLPGLAAYHDDSNSDSEEISKSSTSAMPLGKPAAMANAGSSSSNGKSTKVDVGAHAEQRSLAKSQVIIKRNTPLSRQSRASLSSGPPAPTEQRVPRQQDSAPTSDQGSGALEKDNNSHIASSSSLHLSSTLPPDDELPQIRALLNPPPIEGIEDWGIPPPSIEPCDPTIATKVAQFSALKRDPDAPKHFNDSLMSNRSFRNPHLYAQLVQFVDIDERTTNFPKELWDPEDVREEWFADRVAAVQKTRSEQQSSSSSGGKRSHIDFTSSSSSSKKTKVPQPLYGSGVLGEHHHHGSGGGNWGQGKYDRDRGKSRWI